MPDRKVPLPLASTAASASVGGLAVVVLIADPLPGLLLLAVVVTDMMMPGMDGAATIRALQAIRPDVPVIAASGLHSHAAVARATALGVSEFLAKPFSIDALLQALRTATAAGPGDRGTSAQNHAPGPQPPASQHPVQGARILSCSVTRFGASACEGG